MATPNPFHVLRDDDSGDNSELPSKNQQQQQPAKLPSEPLPPAQAVREKRSEGGRGGGGHGYRRRHGGCQWDSANNERSFSNIGAPGGQGTHEDGDAWITSERHGYGGGAFRGGHRGGFTNGEAGVEGMTLEEYEKVQEEKSKPLQALKTQERKVDDKQFDSMKQLQSKKENNDVFIKLESGKDKKREASESDEKAKKFDRMHCKSQMSKLNAISSLAFIKFKYPSPAVAFEGESSKVVEGECSNSQAPSQTSLRSNKLNLHEKVLEPSFNNSKSSEHEPSTMNWRNVAQAIQASLNLYARGDEYHHSTKSPKQHCNSTRSYFQEGKGQKNLAQRADGKAWQDIFLARNKGTKNVVTIDLRGQRVRRAVKILQMHLFFGACMRSIQSLTVITEREIKQSVIKLLEKEGVECREDNQGRLLIEPDCYKGYSFLKQAAAAYSKGRREDAAYLSDCGKGQKNLARKADGKAWQDIFLARNKDIENVLTIDFHGQHLRQAMMILETHLIFGAYARCHRTSEKRGCGMEKGKRR